MDGLGKHKDSANRAGNRVQDDGPRDAPIQISAEAMHEFSNLLTILLGNLARLRRQPLDERGRHHLEQAETAADQAAHLLRGYIGKYKLDGAPSGDTVA